MLCLKDKLTVAVPEGKRAKSKLAFHTKAIELADYTTTICNNNNIFPKRDRWMISSKIVDASLSILINVITANNTYVTTKQDYLERRKFQKVARNATSELLALMELAYAKYHIESKRIRHWTGLVYEERKLILKWMKSDKDRFQNLK